MRPSIAASLVLTTALSLAACGGDDGGGDDGSSMIDAGEQGVDASLDGFVELLGVDYTIAPGSEPYRCATLTVTEDLYIRALVDRSPAGTHHTVLSVGPADGTDRAGYNCSVGDNEMQMLFASGVGSDAFRFPDGVAIKVAAGQQLKINVHLYNGSQEPLSGRAAALVELVPAAEVAGLELAEMVFAGTLAISLKNDGEPKESRGTCGMKTATLVNVWPHMHQLGRHMKVTVAGQTIHDAAFDFEEQKNWPVDLAVTAGQEMVVTCTHVNDTDINPVTWGDSSDKEMCFAGFYRYPAVGGGMFCDIIGL
jgi:hypothetical protein